MYLQSKIENLGSEFQHAVTIRYHVLFLAEQIKAISKLPHRKMIEVVDCDLDRDHFELPDIYRIRIVFRDIN